MALSIADQIALDDALVAPADRLKIGKCNLRLSSDVTSKEATLQVVYDVLKLTPFYKAFQVTADAPKIYMQEFWASAYAHNRSVRFKMNNNFNTDIANHTSSSYIYGRSSDNVWTRTNVEGAKSDEEATYEEDQGNEAVEDTNTDLDRRDDVMTDV
ncbi:hypothetical protein Tco_1427677 [Tanacetum coccineum]